MAGNAISINILSNVREAVRGVDDAADAVEEVADRLHDLTKEGDTSTDRMERNFRDLTKAADKSADDLKAKFRDAYQSVRRNADDAADDAVRAQRRIGERSAEVGQEVRQNLGEGIANAARGDFESLADSIGDTFGGAVAGIGGIGTAAIGAAGALGVGALVAAFVAAEEERKKLEQRAGDLAQAYIDAGTNVLDTITIAARTSSILTDPEQRKEAEELAKVLGVDLATAARAYAGDTNAVATANEILSSTEEERQRLMKSSADYIQGDLTTAERDRLNLLLDQRREVDELNNVNSMANDTFAAQQQVLIGLINTAEGVTKEVDEVGNAVYNLPDGTQIMIDAETGQATTDISNFKGDVDGIPENVTTNVHVNVPDLTAVRRRIINDLDGIPVTVRVQGQTGYGRFVID